MDREWTDKRMGDFADRVGRFEVDVKERFDKVDHRFDKADDRFDKVESKIDDRFDKVDSKIGQMNRTLIGGLLAIIAAIVGQHFLG